MKPLSYEPLNPALLKYPAIEVPQGCYGMSMWTEASKRVRFMTADMGPCVAVALVGYGDDSEYPMVTYGHIDGMVDEVQSMRFLLNGFSKFVDAKDTTAYAVQGDIGGAVLDSVLRQLNGVELEDLFVYADCIQETLTIDLVTGKPYGIGKECLPTYGPDMRTGQMLKTYIRGSRAFSPFPGIVGSDIGGHPMARAFNLAEGIPHYYELKMPRNRPVPAAVPTC